MKMLKQLAHSNLRHRFSTLAVLVMSFIGVNGFWRCTTAKSSSTASPSCIQDSPTSTVKMTKLSALRCANHCNPTKTNCIAYQYDTQLQQCQSYDYLPTNWSQIKTGCQAFYCSGYVATNRTLNVSISSAVGVVPLNSVGGWLTVLSRIDHNVPTGPFSTTYTNGFGNISNNFWLGLEKTYQLTNGAVNGGKTYKLRIELQGSSGQWQSIEYDWFYLESSAASYTLRVPSTSTRDVNDALNDSSPTNNKPFASSGTWCVNTYGPWWYTGATSCSNANFFTPYMYWVGIGPDTLALTARMLVKVVS